MHRGEQHFDKGGLARSIRTEKAEGGPPSNSERNIIHGANLATLPAGPEYFRQSGSFDGVVGIH